MSSAAKPAKPSDARVVQLNFPGTLRPKTPEVETPQGGNVTKSQVNSTVTIQTVGIHAAEPIVTERRGPTKRAKGERVDWDGMEPHYRANKLTLRELGEMYGVSNPAILKHARVHGWVRDLQDTIDAKVEDLVNRASVSKQVSKEQMLTTAVVVQATSELIANVRLGQRDRFKQVAGLAVEMFVALRDQFVSRESLETLGGLMDTVDDNGKPDALSKLYREVTELPSQIRSLRDLTDIIAKLTAMETTAYKLEKAPEGTDHTRASLPIRFVDSPPMVQLVDDDDNEDAA